MAAQNNWWDNYETVSGAGTSTPRASGGMRVERLPPDPLAASRDARDQSRFNMEVEDRNNKKAKEAKEAAEAEQQRRSAYANAKQKLLGTIGKLGRIGLDANDSWASPGLLETGASGEAARAISPILSLGATRPARDLASDIDTLQARFAFDALDAMRQASKTGGALGQVTERELDLLKASVSNINPDQGHKQFMRNLEDARQAYLSKMALVEPELARRLGYDREKAEQAWISLNDAYAEELGLNGDVTFADQQSLPDETATPSDIDAILKKYGVE